jgi:hypothetical protein
MRPSAALRPASVVSLTLGLRLERLLEVFRINTHLRPLIPGHLRPFRSVHLDELSFGWASGESISPAASAYRTSSNVSCCPRMISIRPIKREVMDAIAADLLTVLPYHLE